MTMYWRVDALPELQGLSKDQQTQLVRSSFRTVRRRPLIVISYALLGIALVAGLLLRDQFAGFGGPVLEAFWPAVMAWLIGGIGWQITMVALRPQLAARRAALEPKPRHDDGSYYVPPAF